MELIVGILELSALALALAFIVALFQDDWALRIAAILIARKDARVAYREKYAEELARREAEFGLQDSLLASSAYRVEE